MLNLFYNVFDLLNFVHFWLEVNFLIVNQVLTLVLIFLDYTLLLIQVLINTNFLIRLPIKCAHYLILIIVRLHVSGFNLTHWTLILIAYSLTTLPAALLVVFLTALLTALLKILDKL